MLVHEFNFVFVVVIYYHQWPKVMLRSLREHFSNELILVNHLGEDLPPEYFDDNCTILKNNSNCFKHGDGIDIAVEHLKERGIDYFVHIEPDCLITGKEWLEELVKAAKVGAIMAGPHRLPFGPIHPCPSIWHVPRIVESFNISARTETLDRNIFKYKKMVRWLYENDLAERGVIIWCDMWDCGIKNWYEAAKLNLAINTNSTVGFRHFWSGSSRKPNELSEQDYSLVKKYLD